MRHYINLVLISLVAIFIHGYQFAVSDQEIFIPYVLKSQNASLFPSDQLFNQSSAHASLFYPVIGFLIKFFDIQTAFFAGYLIFQFAFFTALYHLAKVLIKDKNLSYLSLLPFFLPKFIGGTATPTFDNFFGYRSIGIIFLILYLSYLLQNKFKQAVLIAFLGLVFHPLSIIPNLLLLPASIVNLNKSPRKTSKVVALSLPIILASIIILVFIGSKIFPLRDDIWLSIIKFRDDYLFASTWSYRAWGAIGLYLMIIVLFLGNLQLKIRRTILLFIICSLTVFLLYILTIEIFKITYIAQLQLLRALTPLAYLGLAMSPLFLIYKKPVLKIFGASTFISLCTNQFNLLLISSALFILVLILDKGKQTINISENYLVAISLTVFIFAILINPKLLTIDQRIQYPKRMNNWINVQLWAKENTQKTDIFLVPPDQTGFRIYSQRPIVADIKDGAVSMYNPNYAKNWFAKINDLNLYQNFLDNDFQKLKQSYNFDFIVVPNSQKLNFEKVYENSRFTVYRI